MGRILASAVLAASVSACVTAPKTTYFWGSYEQVIYANHANPGASDPQSQLTILEKDYQTARATNQRLPPGWHAHLAYLYYQLGKADQAHQEFVTEKTQFPESALFIDRLLAKMKKP
jgi:hypothetical protein